MDDHVSAYADLDALSREVPAMGALIRAKGLPLTYGLLVDGQVAFLVMYDYEEAADRPLVARIRAWGDIVRRILPELGHPSPQTLATFTIDQAGRMEIQDEATGV